MFGLRYGTAGSSSGVGSRIKLSVAAKFLGQGEENAMPVKAVPKGRHTITLDLIVKGADEALEFYKKAFGAQVVAIHKTPEGRVMHAEFRIGDSRLFLADEFPGMGPPSPKTLGGSPVVLNLYMDNIDRLFNQAVAAGATVTLPLANQFWGDRYGQLKDPFGHTWALGQHVEDVSPEEMKRRSREIRPQMEMALEGDVDPDLEPD
jgi:PhnB protein